MGLALMNDLGLMDGTGMGPLVNVDGTPMVNEWLDANGHPFGVTDASFGDFGDDAWGVGGSFGHGSEDAFGSFGSSFGGSFGGSDW